MKRLRALFRFRANAAQSRNEVSPSCDQQPGRCQSPNPSIPTMPSSIQKEDSFPLESSIRMAPPTNWTPPPPQQHKVDTMDSVISDEHIAQVALFLPRWEDVAGQLCIGRLETDHIRAEPGTTIQTKNLRVLQSWKARWFHQATYRKLYQVLRMLGEAQSADRVLCVMQGTDYACQVLFSTPSSHVTVPPHHGEDSQEVPKCIATFARQQKELYFRMNILPDEDWPPSIGRHKSNLVMIEHERDSLPGAEETEEMQRDYVGGRVDRIAERKKEIRYEDIFDYKATVDNSKRVLYDSKHFRMLIDGAPGVGKTTLCRTFCKDWCAGKILKQFSIVWLLHMRDESIAKAKSLDDLFQHYDEVLLREIVQHIKKTGGEGNLLVCDGFDELSEKERTQHSLFLDIIRGKVLPNCSVIVSSRPYASQKLQEMGSITHHVEIAGFTEKQIKECIRKNITDKPKAEELIEQLKQRLDILSLCYTPLNAAITLYIYKQEKHILPTTLTQLYALYILHSLKRSVEIHIENLIALDITDLKNLPDPIALPFIALCEMAYNGLQDDQLGFSTSQLPQSLQGCPGCKGTKPDLLGLMSGSKRFTGSNAEVSYHFTHLTVQEFLAAWYAAIALSAEEQSKLFMEKTSDDRFRMMLLFLAGITGLQDTQVYQQILFKSCLQILKLHLLNVERDVHMIHMANLRPPPILQTWIEELQQKHCRLQQQQLQGMEIQQLLAKTGESKSLKEFFFFYHLIYESQNTSLSCILAQVLASTDGTLYLNFFVSYDLFECTVVAYFLSTCNFPWKHLSLVNVTDEQMEVIHQVWCEHAGSSDVSGQFFKHTQKLSLHIIFRDNTPPPKPTSFSYLLNMKLMSLSVSFDKAKGAKYCSIFFNVLTHHTTLQKLRITRIEDCAFHTKEFKDLLVHNHSLKELDISRNKITSVGATSVFRALVSNTTLESLDMSRNKLQSTSNSPSLPIPSQLLAQPTPALSTTHSQLLSPSPTPHDAGVSAALADMLSHNNTLTELSVTKCGLTHQSCVSMFKSLKHNSSLKKLDISETTFDQAASEALAEMLSHNSTLTELNVTKCGLTPQSCVTMFKSLKHNSSLKKLDISVIETTFDQAASEALAGMLSCNNSLTELDICECGCQPKALARGLLHNTTLTIVFICESDCHSITQALVDLRRENGHTQQPDPEVARCENLLVMGC